MAKRIIPIEVRDEYILGAGRVIGAKGSHDDVALRVEFNEMWRGKSVTAVWLNAVGESPVVAPINFSNWEGSNPLICIIDIPAKAKSAVGDAMLTIRGFTSVDGETESTATLTATAYFKVLESDFDNEAEEEEEEDKLNLYKQLQNNITALEITLSNAIVASGEAVNAKDDVLSAKEEIDMTKADIDSILVDCQSCADNAAASESNASTYAENAFGHMGAAAISAGAALGAKQDAESAKAEAKTAQGKAETAQTNAEQAYADANDAATNAGNSATEAKSWAVGGTNSRNGENTNNAKYWSDQAAISKGDAVQSAVDAGKSASAAAASASTAQSAASKAHSDVEAIQDTIDEFMDSGIEEAASAAREEVDRILAELEPPIDEAIGYANDAAASADRAYREAERAEAAADRAEAGGGGGDVSKAYVDAELAKKFDKAGGTIDGDVVIGDGSLVEDMDGNMEERKVVLHYGKTMLGFANGALADVTGILDYEYGGGKIKGLENAEADDEAVPFGQMREYVAENGGTGNVAYDATPLVTATATDPDGKTYTGATEYEVTIPNADELFVGVQITVVPTMKSATMKPFITVNGARGRIYTNAATTGAFFNGTRVDFIGANKPLALMYMGIVDEANNIGGWKCLNSVRVNLEALTSNGNADIGSIPMANGVNEKLLWKTPAEINADINADTVFNATSNDGVTYAVTIPNVNSLYAGLKIIIVPNRVSASTLPKLNVNGLGAKNMYCKASGRTGGYLQSTNENVLAAGVPVELIYTGVHWKIDITRPNAENIYGTVAVDNGGTGRETLTSGYYLVGNGTGAVQLKSKSAVLSDIGAASKTELEQVKSSVSEGKALIASAVTDKGVTTAGDATFAKIAENIGLIMGGELSGGAEYPELTNEGTSADLRKDKELINDEGEVVVGTMETFDGSYECSDDGTGGIKPIIDSLDVTPAATDRTYDATEEGLDGYSPVVVRGDGNLAAENIVEGVSIFGVTGTAKTGGGGGVAKTVPVSITSRNGAMVKVVASCMGDSSTPSLYKEEHITAVSFEAVCGTLIYIKSLEFLIPSYTATGGSELVSLNNADWVFSVPETSSGGTIQITIWDDD